MPRGIWKRTEEDFRKIRECLNWKGKKQTSEHIQKRIKWHQGKPLSLKHRLSLSKNHADVKNEKNPCWKGDDASYTAKHMWIRKHFGKAIICQNPNCKYKNIKRYEWANISKEYKRDKNDYIQLCPSCHRKWDAGILSINIKIIELDKPLLTLKQGRKEKLSNAKNHSLWR